MRTEQIGRHTLYLGDYRDILPSLATDSYDCVVMDPPYGINYRSNHNSSRRGKWARWARHENMPGIIGDDRPLDAQPFLGLGVPLVIWGGNYCADQLPASRCWIVWDKRDGISPNNQADCELAWTNLDKPSRIHRQMWSGFLRACVENVAKQPKQHPHQKPVALMETCIWYAGGTKVLDPFMGSASTGVACEQMGLAFVGIETDQKYFDIARARISEAVSQPRMFATPTGTGPRPSFSGDKNDRGALLDAMEPKQ